MSAGTLLLTNGNKTVWGTGTSFATELAAGDFVVVTVGGVPYTLPVLSIESATQLTLVSVYPGPTQAGAAWSAVPRVALNMVTAALVAQSAEALRGLNYDKQNWQQVFSGTGTISVKLPDGSTYTGPAWNGITDSLNGKAGRAANLSDLTDKAEARSQLGLYRTPGRWYPSDHPEVAARFGFHGATNTDGTEMLAYIGKDCLRLKGIFRSDSVTVIAGTNVLTVKPIDIDGAIRSVAVATYTPVYASYSNGLQPSVLSYFSTAKTTTGQQLSIPFVGASIGVNFIMFDLHIGFLS